MQEHSKQVLNEFRDFVLEQTPSVLGFERLAPDVMFPKPVTPSFCYRFVFPLMTIVQGKWVRLELFLEGSYNGHDLCDLLLGRIGFAVPAKKEDTRSYQDHSTLFFVQKKDDWIVFEYKPFGHPEQYDAEGKFSNPYLNLTSDAFGVYRQFLADFKTNIFRYISSLLAMDLVAVEGKTMVPDWIFPPKILQRGQVMSLLNVKGLELRNDEESNRRTLTGTVISSDFHQEYSVCLFFDGRSTFISGACSCPFYRSQHVLCKHIAAVAETVERNELVAIR